MNTTKRTLGACMIHAMNTIDDIAIANDFPGEVNYLPKAHMRKLAISASKDLVRVYGAMKALKNDPLSRLGLAARRGFAASSAIMPGQQKGSGQ